MPGIDDADLTDRDYDTAVPELATHGGEPVEATPAPAERAAEPEEPSIRAEAATEPAGPAETRPGLPPERPGGEPRQCPWCSADAPPDATRCPSCGAALVESASANAAIPGVTAVDRNVVADEVWARRRFEQARAPSTHVLGQALGLMGGGIVGHAIGNALEDMMLKRISGADSDVNAMSLMDLRLLDAKFDDDGHPRPSTPPPLAPEGPEAGSGGDDRAAIADPWADLPPPSMEDQITGTEFDPWAIRDQSAAAARYDPWAAADTPPATPSPPATDPWATDSGPWSEDPWSSDPGPWGRDVWDSPNGQSGDHPTEPRKPR